MLKARIFGITISVLSILCIITTFLLLAGGWQERLSTITGRSGLQAADTPIYLPYVSDQASEDERSAPNGQQSEVSTVPEGATAELETTPTALPPEAFASPVPYIPAPLPPLTSTTEPEKAYVSLNNLRLLKLPSEQHSSFGVLTWSPDSKQFMGHMGDNEGRSVAGLYIGNTETGDLQLWQANGGWPYWSRDGQTVYYLSFHNDGNSMVYDLYRRSLINEQSELIRANVEYPYYFQTAAAETISGDILFLDTKRHPVRQPIIQSTTDGAWPEPQSVLALLEKGETSLADQEVHFSVSPDGRFVALISQQPPIYLLDLQVGKQIAALESVAYYPQNIGWSEDSQWIAYTTNDGVYTYNLTTAEVTTLVTRKDLGFNLDDMRSGFGMPYWSPSGEIVIFTAVSQDWNFQLPVAEQRPHTLSLTFATTKNGDTREIIPQYMIEHLSPDGAHAFVEGWNSELQLYEKYVADVTWR